MSMSQPLEPDLPASEAGVAAADAGLGAPRPAPGHGPRTGEPDVSSEVGGDPDADVQLPDRTPFRTPDPDEVSRTHGK